MEPTISKRLFGAVIAEAPILKREETVHQAQDSPREELVLEEQHGDPDAQDQCSGEEERKDLLGLGLPFGVPEWKGQGPRSREDEVGLGKLERAGEVEKAIQIAPF